MMVHVFSIVPKGDDSNIVKNNRRSLQIFSRTNQTWHEASVWRRFELVRMKGHIPPQEEVIATKCMIIHSELKQSLHQSLPDLARWRPIVVDVNLSHVCLPLQNRGCCEPNLAHSMFERRAFKFVHMKIWFFLFQIGVNRQINSLVPWLPD